MRHGRMLLASYQRSRRRPPPPWGFRDARSIDCGGSVVVTQQRQLWISSVFDSSSWVQCGCRLQLYTKWSVQSSSSSSSSSHWNVITGQRATYPPPPYGLPLMLQQQQQQKRYVGKGLPHIRKQAKRYGYTNDDAKLQICYSDYDLLLDTELEDAFDEDSEDMTFAKVKFKLSDIKQAVQAIYDDSRQLQYYDRAEHKWHPLTDLETAAHLQRYRGGKQVLKVRVPEYYDYTPMVMGNEQDHDEDLDFDPNDENRLLKPNAKKEGLLRRHPPDMVARYLERTIKRLVAQLKESGHVRAHGVIYGDHGHQETVYAVRHSETNDKRSTRDYVLQVATTRPQNRRLARLLLAVPGALDHVVRGMHYDCLWEPRYVPRRPRYRTKYRPR